jgi:nitrite reductase/ring-hydroxylating ferredoxin subunit
MKICSKILFFFIVAVPVLAVSSCNEVNNDVIPDIYIDFTIDLQDPEFTNLSISGNSDTIDASTHNWGERAAGFDGNGIIIYTGPDEFYAYDRTCPYDYVVNKLSIKVVVDISLAVCPYCGTSYSLAAFGIPASGVGKYPLKNYNTSLEEDRYLRVWNK